MNLLRSLPTKGEFYTDEAVAKATPYVPVLFALTEKDIDQKDIYPFVAISRGLFDQRQTRDYAAHNFMKIRHPTLKLLWGAMLFDSNMSTSEIKRYLQDALATKDQAELLAEMVGPQFESFKKRVLSN